jgi:hypothetical protein
MRARIVNVNCSFINCLQNLVSLSKFNKFRDFAGFFSIFCLHEKVILMRALEKEEMGYWEKKYSYRGALFPPSYRIFERDRFLFHQLKKISGAKS